MSDLSHHIRQYVAPSDWLIILAGILIFLFLKWATWTLGVPPLEWVALGGVGVVFFLIRSIQFPLLLLILIAVGSLLGNLILVFEDGLIPFSLFQIFYLLSIGVFILRWFMLGFAPIKKTGFELELALFFGLIFLSILWTPDAERAFWHAMRMLALSGLLFLLVNWIDSPRQITWLISSLIAVGVVLGLVAVLHTINNPMAILQDMMSAGTRQASRARIGQMDPNVFASLFFLPLAFTASISFSKINIYIRLTSAVLFLLLLSAVLISFSRSAWISIIIMLIFLAIFYRQYNLFLIAAVITGLLLLFVPDLRLIFMAVLNRFIGLFSGEIDSSNFIRILLAYAALGMFFNSWLIGVGWRGFPDYIFDYYTYQDTMAVYEPHNVLYLVFAELGILGLLIFCFVVYKIFKLAWENIKLSRGVEHRALAYSTYGAFLAYAIFYQFIGSGFVDNQLWITTGLILSLNFYLTSKDRTERIPL